MDNDETQEYEIAGAITITAVHRATITARSEEEATQLFDAALLRGDYDDELQQAFDPRQHDGLTSDWTEAER